MDEKKIDDGNPAFPALTHTGDGGRGMSLRDWFAGQAVCGTDWWSDWPDRADAYRELAKRAYRLADAMLAERSKAK